MNAAPASQNAGSVAGIDAGRVTAWMADHTDITPPLQFKLIAGGART